LKSAYLRASCTKSIVPIKLCIEIYLTRLLFFKTLRKLGAIFETPCITESTEVMPPKILFDCFIKHQEKIDYGGKEKTIISVKSS
jgi:hypothetical protein